MYLKQSHKFNSSIRNEHVSSFEDSRVHSSSPSPPSPSKFNSSIFVANDWDTALSSSTVDVRLFAVSVLFNVKRFSKTAICHLRYETFELTKLTIDYESIKNWPVSRSSFAMFASSFRISSFANFTLSRNSWSDTEEHFTRSTLWIIFTSLGNSFGKDSLLKCLVSSGTSSDLQYGNCTI